MADIHIASAPSCGVASITVGARRVVMAEIVTVAAAQIALAAAARLVQISPAEPSGWGASAFVGGTLLAAVPIARMLRRGEHYWLMIAGMALFGILREKPRELFAAGVGQPWGSAFMALTIGAAVVTVAGLVGQVRRTDEMWRQINYEGLAFGFLGSLVAVLGLALVSDLGLTVPVWWIAIAMLALWGVGVLAATRRYR